MTNKQSKSCLYSQQSNMQIDYVGSSSALNLLYRRPGVSNFVDEPLDRNTSSAQIKFNTDSDSSILVNFVELPKNSIRSNDALDVMLIKREETASHQNPENEYHCTCVESCQRDELQTLCGNEGSTLSTSIAEQNGNYGLRLTKR